MFFGLRLVFSVALSTPILGSTIIQTGVQVRPAAVGRLLLWIGLNACGRVEVLFLQCSGLASKTGRTVFGRCWMLAGGCEARDQRRVALHAVCALLHALPISPAKPWALLADCGRGAHLSGSHLLCGQPMVAEPPPAAGSAGAAAEAGAGDTAAGC